MKVIEVFFRDELLSEYHVAKNTMKIGRAKWNDIILADPTVSREHAAINYENGKLTIVDNSSGGTFINNGKIARKALDIDDRITIGPYSLFIRQVGEEQEEFGLDTTIHHRQSAVHSLHDQTGKSFLLHTAALHAVEGPLRGKKFPINKEKVTFGKSKENDLVFADEFVSRHHGEIIFRNGDFFIRDLGSKNGLFVNGKQVQGAILTHGARIEAGRNIIDFTVMEDSGAALSEKGEQPEEIIGESEKFRSLYALLKKAASCDATVLICGDTGTGKELAARTVHSISNRSKGPFVTIDCGSIPRDLIESELFGHEKGAFTGARSRRTGAFERGHRGTVFLDEIGEIPRDLQPRLLRILEERSFKRVGGDSHIPTDIRVVAATNRDLSAEVKKGNFREDLFFRLYVVPVFMPRLNEMVEDIPLLADFFIKKAEQSAGRKNMTIIDEAMKKLKEYPWPGNVRELKNTIERAVVGSEGKTITARDIQFITSVREEPKTSVLPRGTLEEIEKQTIINALKAQGGNKKATAKVLGIAYSTMCEKVKKYKLEI